ncbi:armadillo-type protein [Lipomyces japonicus]|uniref:armadillo-type protein n=1 Tax=Lipomyces japonicus TaxID=56871 RepID=UPI0034CE6761
MILAEEFRRVEQKIIELYQPGDSQKIHETQHELQQLQKSAEGWQLANMMLQSDVANVRFFGALTYTVKLNTDWTSVPESMIPELISTLLSWFVRTWSGPRFISQKLASTLVLAMVKFAKIWADPVLDVMMSIDQDRPCYGSTVNNEAQLDMCLTRLGTKVGSVFMFCATVAEEIGRVEVSRQDRADLVAALNRSSQHVISLIKPILTADPLRISDKEHAIVGEAMKCLKAWAMVIVSYDTMSRAMPALVDMIRGLISWLQRDNDEDLFPLTTDVLIEVMEWSEKLVPAATIDVLLGVLTSDWAQRVLASGDEDIAAALLNLLVSFGELVAKDVARALDQDRPRRLVSLMLALASGPGVAVVQDAIVARTVEFWELLVEAVAYDEDFPTSSDGSAAAAVTATMDAVLAAARTLRAKIMVPAESDAVRGWPTDAREGFFAFRRDVADVIETGYAIVHARMFADIAADIVGVLGKANDINSSTDNGGDAIIDWSMVEASLFCLNAMANGFGSEPVQEYEWLGRIIEAGLFDRLANDDRGATTQVRQTSVQFIGSALVGYLQTEAGQAQLPAVVTYLFGRLGADDGGVAARSLATICEDCADVLRADAPTFVQAWAQIAAAPADVVDWSVKERVAGGVASVVHAVPDQRDRAVGLIAVVAGVEIMMDRIADEDDAAGVLRCFVAVAKAAGGDAGNNNDHDAIDAELRQRVFTTIVKVAIGSRFAGRLAVRQAAAAAIRQGFKEPQPGPFTFAADAVAEYIVAEVRVVGVPETLQPVYSVACGLVIASVTGAVEAVDRAVAALFEVATEPASPGATDPDVRQGMLEVIDRLAQKRPAGVTSSHLVFAAAALDGPEPGVVRAASRAWTSYFATAVEVDPGAGKQALAAAGRAMQGHAARSVVRDHAAVIRAAMRRIPGPASAWLRQGLTPDSPAAQKVVAQLAALRGRGLSDTVVREFWLLSRSGQ